MHILLTGGTGLMGRRLCARWRQAGHRLTVFSRRPQQVESLCGVGVRGIDRFDEYGDQPLDAVVNLAGEPIADKPWSHKRKALLWESRVRLTERLVEWLDAREQRPDLLLSGSAVGWYGDSGERPVTEEGAAAGEDFASELCLAWEQIAREAEKLGTRVVLLRTGLVLAPEGGFLGRLLPLYRLGLGGPLGDGRQWMPWIHIEDQIELIDFFCGGPMPAVPIMRALPTRCATAISPRPWAGRCTSRRGYRPPGSSCASGWEKCPDCCSAASEPCRNACRTPATVFNSPTWTWRWPMSWTPDERIRHDRECPAVAQPGLPRIRPGWRMSAAISTSSSWIPTWSTCPGRCGACWCR